MTFGSPGNLPRDQKHRLIYGARNISWRRSARLRAANQHLRVILGRCIVLRAASGDLGAGRASSRGSGHGRSLLRRWEHNENIELVCQDIIDRPRRSLFPVRSVDRKDDASLLHRRARPRRLLGPATRQRGRRPQSILCCSCRSAWHGRRTPDTDRSRCAQHAPTQEFRHPAGAAHEALSRHLGDADGGVIRHNHPPAAPREKKTAAPHERQAGPQEKEQARFVGVTAWAKRRGSAVSAAEG
jgi:hypothetical protein